MRNLETLKIPKPIINEVKIKPTASMILPIVSGTNMKLSTKKMKAKLFLFNSFLAILNFPILKYCE